MQQGRCDGGVIQLELGEDRGDFERMGKVGSPEARFWLLCAFIA